MIINVKTSTSSYDVIIKKHSLDNIEEYIDLNRKVLIVSDDNVPQEYANKVINKAYNSHLFIIEHGERSKVLENALKMIDILIEDGFSRNDCIVAVGGGVVGDLAGFVASIFKRGIQFYNIPTTLLSQVDSSIGGKTAIDYKSIKNVIGSFYPPSKVIIDTTTLKTLNTRQLHAGLVESIKMAMTFDETLFELIEKTDDLFSNIDEIVYRSLLIKKEVVEKDEKENGLRKVLNFGHTIGHGLESYFDTLYLHGECVGLGMLYMVSKDLKDRLTKLLVKYGLPVKVKYEKDKVFSFIVNDKKTTGTYIDIIEVEKIGTFSIKQVPIRKIKDYL